MVVRFLIVVVVAAALALPQAGSFLVVDQPVPSDAGVVLEGSPTDFRMNQGIDLVKKGITRELFLDADTKMVYFGKTLAQHAQDYVQALPPELAAHVHVCPLTARSTAEEAYDAARCLAPMHPSRVLLITSDYHTCRALSVFHTILPKYSWSISASHDPAEFREDYWKSREWTKTTFLEWQKLLFWNLLERWRVHPAS